MSAFLEASRCTGCPRAGEAPCERACPGGLVVRGQGKAQLRDAGACWDCAACVKACPWQALYLALPWPVGNGEARLYARARPLETEWLLRLPSGEEKKYTTPARTRGARQAALGGSGGDSIS